MTDFSHEPRLLQRITLDSWAVAIAVTFIGAVFTPWAYVVGFILAGVAFAGWAWPRGGKPEDQFRPTYSDRVQ